MTSSQTAWPYRRSPDQDRVEPAHHPVIVVGAGPVGLTVALDLARKGHHVVALDRRQQVSDGSRAICWSKRTLEIMDRLGLADDLIAQGVTWSTGKVFHRDAEVFAFDLLPERGHRCPAFVNLQQFYFEAACVEAATATGRVDLRWGHEVASIAGAADGVRLQVTTPDGAYALTADWLIAADGARSPIRQQLGLGFVGQAFDDQFLICDIKMTGERPTERWFWFDPPFNPGQSALLHRQAGNVWRLDFQIGNDADRDEEMKPANVARRVRAMLGDIDFSFAWISCYRFQCRRLERFVHDRVVFVGDAAHQVSPFGARGGNSGVQDADNLAWKLDLMLRDLAPKTLIASYDVERRLAADENILNSTRATDFISPKGPGARQFRDAVLSLAATEPFARRLLNSGRLSLPTTYDGSDLNTPDGFSAGDTPELRPGSAARDAPTDAGWLLSQLGGGFSLLDLDPASKAAHPDADSQPSTVAGLPLTRMRPTHPDALARYGAADAAAIYLIRPDQHVAARWRHRDFDAIARAMCHATQRF